MTRALAIGDPKAPGVYGGKCDACRVDLDRLWTVASASSVTCLACSGITPCEACGKPSTVTVTAGMNTLAFCAACHAGMLSDHANGLCLGCREMRGTCANGCEPIGPSDFQPIVEA